MGTSQYGQCGMPTDILNDCRLTYGHISSHMVIKYQFGYSAITCLIIRELQSSILERIVLRIWLDDHRSLLDGTLTISSHFQHQMKTTHWERWTIELSNQLSYLAISEIPIQP